MVHIQFAVACSPSLRSLVTSSSAFGKLCDFYDSQFRLSKCPFSRILGPFCVSGILRLGGGGRSLAFRKNATFLEFKGYRVLVLSIIIASQRPRFHHSRLEVPLFSTNWPSMCGSCLIRADSPISTANLCGFDT